MNQGIYKITNRTNGKVYIGSSNKCKSRMSRHFLELRRGVHRNRELQADFDYCGEMAFAREIVHPVADYDPVEIQLLENYYISEYQESGCYNKAEANITLDTPYKEIPNDPLLRKSFFDRVIYQDGCWDWIGAIENGYGIINYRGKEFRASRISYFIHNGEQPGSLMVCHTCDNPICCNPKHLFLGTAKDNADDRKAKHRGGLPWITYDVATSIRKEYQNTNVTLQDIADRFNCCFHTIRNIVKNRTYYDPNYIFIKSNKPKTGDILKIKLIRKNRGLSLNCKTYSATYVADMFGVSQATICGWIRHKLIEDYTRVSKKNHFTINHIINLRSVANYHKDREWMYGKSDLERVRRYHERRFKYLTEGKSMNQESIDHNMKVLTHRI